MSGCRESRVTCPHITSYPILTAPNGSVARAVVSVEGGLPGCGALASTLRGCGRGGG